MASEQEYLELEMPNGERWQIWPDGRHRLIFHAEGQDMAQGGFIPARELAAKLFEAEQQLAQARALLERVADFDSYDDYSIQPLQEEIRAFLAQ